ncbi:MAG TPA: tRNA (adenosine(37)-N6)-threonylcarbamoyltransferase complex transferase subunit TsaD [Phycisphaerales bacterium]|nr:tRNA (adenosine(37)-N6)-threonylcarbamoyltransferase complex transferase subunit TsaD [Phycisphaerales bacterium]
MLVLGIESSCDETAAAVVRDGREVLTNIVASQHEIHAEFGGVVPELASRAHAERITGVLQEAVEQAGVTLDQIDAVAVGHRPGLIGALLVGVSSAKALSWSLGVPLVGVDHIRAHLWAGLLGSDLALDNVYPALGLVVSGGHSSIFRMTGPNDLELLGSTIDDAIGEAYDKAAAILGLGHPGGPAIDRLAREPGADDRAVDLPVSRLGKESLDFSFSGLKTALLYAVRGVPGPGGIFPRTIDELDPSRKRDLAASFQRAACRAVLFKLERASQTGAFRTLLVGGGVSANSKLRNDLKVWTDRIGMNLILPEMSYCVDNAAMIAGLAFDRLQQGQADGLELRASPSATP